jgi:hypothetical protein
LVKECEGVSRLAEAACLLEGLLGRRQFLLDLRLCESTHKSEKQHTLRDLGFCRKSHNLSFLLAQL